MKRLRKTRIASTAIFLLLSGLLLPFSVPAALAQATAGSLRGTVTDSTGAVIPDADVVAKSNETGVETKTKTTGDGLYVLPKLLPGTYTLTVQKQGYKRQEFQQVNITIGQDTTIDAALQAGNLTETVTVTAQGEELIQKEQVQ